jgi:hypothetical protein
MKTSKLKKRMSSGSCLTSKLYDKVIKMPSKSHETIPLNCWNLYYPREWSKIVVDYLFLNSKHQFRIRYLINILILILILIIDVEVADDEEQVYQQHQQNMQDKVTFKKKYFN